MNFKIAWRYFVSKKTTNAINIISWVSISSIALGTAALIILLSLFNGLEHFIKGLYNAFNPDLQISAVEGKTFVLNKHDFDKLKNIPEIQLLSLSLEDKVLFSYNDNQSIAYLKGVDSNFFGVHAMQDKIQYGKMDFTTERTPPPIVLGLGIANKIGATEESPLPISCFSFRNSDGYGINNLATYGEQNFQVQGIFFIQEELDAKYALAPLSVVQEVLGREGEISFVNIKLKNVDNTNKIKKQLQSLIPKSLKIETRFEQNKTLFLILRMEKWGVYAVLTLMLIIASFNIIGSLSMLVLEKEKDIAVWKSMGANQNFVKKIFLSVGFILSSVGAFIGILIAYIFCFLQAKYGFLKMGDENNFLVQAYPVKLYLSDFILVVCTIICISFLASWWPANKASKKSLQLSSRF